MVRLNRIARRGLDSLSAFRRLTTLALLVFVFSLGFAPSPASAQTPQDAYQYCLSVQSWINSHEPNLYGGPVTCTFIGSPEVGQPGYYFRTPNMGIVGCGGAQGEVPLHGSCLTSSPYMGNNPCLTIQPVTSTFPGKLLSSYTTGENVQDPASGLTVRCVMAWKPKGYPTYDPRYGWQTYGTLYATGDPASAGDTGPGAGTWVDPSTGQEPPDAGSPLPDPLPPSAGDPPSMCGGGSCYDPGSDNYCAVAGGQQVCVPGPSGRSPSGGCAYGGGGAVCAGAPSAPSPSPGNIPDPPTDIRSTDKTTQADPNTGTPIQVTTNVYAPPNVTTNSGQTSSDTGPSGGGQPTTGNEPAHSSSTSGGGSYAGGGDCSSPPICTGDAATCGAARQQWYAMCSAHADSQQLHKDLTGDGSTPSIPAGPSKSDVWTDGTSTGDSTGDSANQGSYDTTGFGFNTQCPMTDLTVPLWDGKSFTFAMSKGCVVGPWLHGIIIAFALFAAAKITAGAA